MNKKEFLDALFIRLGALPANEVKKTIDYYDEMISDILEENPEFTEEDAVNTLGNLDEIVSHIMYEMPLSTLVKAKMTETKRTSNHTLLIVLSIVGFPLWFPLLMAVLAVVFCVYLTIWISVFTLYALEFSIGLSGIIGIISGAVLCFTTFPVGVFIIGCSIILLSLFLFLFHPILFLTKKIGGLTMVVARYIKSIFIKKEVA